MTSKQLINHLCYEYNTKNYNEERLKAAQEIKKDLEVLEILKRMVIVRKGTTWYYLDTEHPFFESQEDIDKVKEWIENGN